MVINPSFGHFLFPWILWKGSGETSDIYLTFDDGPHPDYTVQTLDLLRQYKAEATFFLIGKKVLLYPGIVERVKQSGHTIGNHSFSHFRMGFKRIGRIKEQILRTDDVIYKIIGQKPIFFRPPHGRFDLRFKNLMSKLNQRIVLWSLFSYDFKESDHVKLVQRIRENLHPGAIIVLHDGHPNSPVMLKALPGILTSIYQLGYRMKKLDALVDRDK